MKLPATTRLTCGCACASQLEPLSSAVIARTSSRASRYSACTWARVRPVLIGCCRGAVVHSLDAVAARARSFMTSLRTSASVRVPTKLMMSVDGYSAWALPAMQAAASVAATTVPLKPKVEARRWFMELSVSDRVVWEPVAFALCAACPWDGGSVGGGCIRVASARRRFVFGWYRPHVDGCGPSLPPQA